MQGEIDLITDSLKTETSPITLVDYLTKLAGFGSYYEGLLEPISKMKPEVWLSIQRCGEDIRKVEHWEQLKKSLSDKKTEMIWLTTEEGQREIEYTNLLKRIDRMSRAIKQNLWAKKIEFNNLHDGI